ncbi:MAG: hypothetical protein A2784_00145 [Candidatus Chisholmbacteria bacterium RIFCSPHIGHO2_01_FULL_48_12]|uniref:Sporulation stage II protein D amidase enhancer LytB N-terminal domain-containing protein n=1 Tax=Candidatus Chisholmbacteria bacterium RIFCSPHIGHO2_01_FULL_48_12 TaxID=1797589 RepID=A0A1G1VL02_9BACT|nr:MAG: hypothetical protein A2784_00145 [Candidatus Chisholmbacteria bacterium RIFCSPHIGHO2_01_FULL_48_12]
MRYILGIALIVGLVSLVGRSLVRAQDCNLSCLEDQIRQLQRDRELSMAATAPLEAELKKLEQKLDSIETQIAAAEKKTESLAESIDERELELAVQYKILAARVRQFYKRQAGGSPLLLLLASPTAEAATRGWVAWQAAVDQDKQVIKGIAGELGTLEADKKRVEADRASLAGLRVQVDKEAGFLRQEVKGAKDYQAQLSGKIAALTARQQEILGEKSGTFQTTVGDVPLADDPNARPDYNPGFSPAFAAFSFGAPHFKGMSQYGAYGRAKSGQSAEEILRAYYGSGIEIKQDYSQDINITVQGYGTFRIEDYVKRIYEMPDAWTDNDGAALKAQAVAARSYALAYTNNGAGTICATESCQVFKAGEKGGNWNAAAEATKGWVIVAGGKPLSAWYASTSGGYQESYSYNGYSTLGFWDTKRGRDGWTSEAYEKIAGSPWFYKGWYKSRSGDSCGRSHPWLTSEEMADILNAWVVLFQGGGDSARVTPQGSCWGGNPYSLSELRAIGGYTNVSGVSVTYADNGVTAEVRLETNKGSVAIKGVDFKKAFNLRAPGRIALKSGLFNIEKK